MKQQKTKGFPSFSPEDEKEGLGDFEFSLPEIQTDDETRFKHYFGKLTNDQNKLTKIREVLTQNDLKVPEKLVIFRKGIFPVQMKNVFLAFDPLARFITVLQYIREDYPIVTAVTPMVRAKITKIISEIKRILEE
jgi:hypothetical protein